MQPKTPKRWANDLTVILRARYSAECFPVQVAELARDYSRQVFPDDPITLVQGEDLTGFDGGLYRAPEGGKGWGIIYNHAMVSHGRINFTLAHEFGHYLLHRLNYRPKLQCSSMDVIRWDSDYKKIEREANDFAATLLMPVDDFRKQLSPGTKPTVDDLGECANRYGVSLTAAALRWIGYTARRSVIVLSRDGFALWARSSNRAFKTGAFIRTAGSPFEIPPSSPAALSGMCGGGATVRHEAGVWLPESCEETTLISDRYEFTISLLHLESAMPSSDPPEDELLPELTGQFGWAK